MSNYKEHFKTHEHTLKFCFIRRMCLSSNINDFSCMTQKVFWIKLVSIDKYWLRTRIKYNVMCFHFCVAAYLIILKIHQIFSTVINTIEYHVNASILWCYCFSKKLNKILYHLFCIVILLYENEQNRRFVENASCRIKNIWVNSFIYFCSTFVYTKYRLPVNSTFPAFFRTKTSISAV